MTPEHSVVTFQNIVVLSYVLQSHASSPQALGMGGGAVSPAGLLEMVQLLRELTRTVQGHLCVPRGDVVP